MADVVIGRLSLKVYPDTSSFRKRAQAEADAIEKQLKPIKLEVELDSDGAVHEAERTHARIEREMDTVQIETDLDTEPAEAEAKTFAQKLKRTMKNVAVNLNLDTGQALAEMAATMKALEAIAQDIHVQMQVDAEHLTNMMDELIAGMRPPAVSVKTKPDLKSIAKTKATIWAAFKDKMDIQVNVKPARAAFDTLARSTGLRVLWELHREKFKNFANLDTLSLKVGYLGLKFQALSAIILATTGNLLSWGRDIGSILRLAIPLPGILTGIGLAAWNMKVAFQDAGKYLPKFQSQWEALQKSMSENFWKQAQKPMQDMIDNLFPKFELGMKRVSTNLGKFTGELARGFTDAMNPRLEGMMDNLAKSIQIAAKGARDLASGLTILVDFGMKQLPGLAESFNSLTRDFNEFMKASEKSGDLQKWTDEGVKNLKALGSVIWETGRMLAGLGKAAAEAGGSTLSSLSQTMKRAADAVASGPFQAALRSFLADVYAFTGDIGDALGRAISKIATELGPMFGQSLRELGPVLAAAMDALVNGLTTPKSVANFKTFFDGLREGVANLQPAFEVLGEKVSAVFSIIGTAFKNLSLIVGSFVQELAVIIGYIQKPLEDLMNALGPSMKSNLDALEPAINGIGQAFATVLGSLKPVAESMGSLKDVISPLSEIIGNVARMVANALKPIFEQWAEMMPDLSKSIGQLLDKFKFLSQFLPSIGTIFGAVFSIISTIVLGTIKTLIDGINNVIEGVINIFSGLIKFVTGVFSGNWSQAWEGIKQIFTGIWQTLLGAFQIWSSVTMLGILRGGLAKITTLWKSGWETVKNFGKTVWEAIVNVAKTGGTKLTTGIKTAIETVKKVWNAGWEFVTAAAKAFWDRMITGFKRMGTGIADAMRTVVETVKTKVGEIPGLIKGKVGEMIAAGSALIEGLKQGILDKAEEALGAVRELASKAADVVKGIWQINSPSKLFRRIAAGIPEGVAQGIKRNTSVAVSAAEAMAKAVGDVPMELNDVLAPDMSKLKSATVSAMGFVNGDAMGPSTVINQTFNNANVDAEESYRRLRFAVQQAKMTPRYGEVV